MMVVLVNDVVPRRGRYKYIFVSLLLDCFCVYLLQTNC